MTITFPLKKFLFKTLLTLPICFTLWYWTAFAWTWPIAISTDIVLRFLFPKLISEIEHIDHTLDVVTRLTSTAQNAQPNQIGDIVFSINPLIYSYSLALYSAILWASPLQLPRTKIYIWLQDLAVLMVLIILGVSIDIIKTIAFDLATPGISSAARFYSWQLNLIGVAYQIGYLVLPAVAPLMLWFRAHKQWFLE